jgi:hypothetical protein
MSKAKRRTAAKPKAKMGRPVTVGATVFIGIKVPPALAEKIDATATKESVTRSEAARRLIELGLKAT